MESGGNWINSIRINRRVYLKNETRRKVAGTMLTHWHVGRSHRNWLTIWRCIDGMFRATLVGVWLPMSSASLPYVLLQLLVDHTFCFSLFPSYYLIYDGDSLANLMHTPCLFHPSSCYIPPIYVPGNSELRQMGKITFLFSI